MILFIHGLGSDAKCYKCQLLKEYYPDAIIPTIGLQHAKASLEFLEALIEKEHITTIMGASMGGFYAQYLAKKYDLDVVLINPVPLVSPLIESHPSHAHTLEIPMVEQIEAFNATHTFKKSAQLLLGLQDETLNPKETMKFFSTVPCLVYDDGHALAKGFEDFLKQGLKTQ